MLRDTTSPFVLLHSFAPSTPGVRVYSYASGGSRGLQAPEYINLNAGPLGPGLFLLQMKRHRIKPSTCSRAEAIIVRRCRKSSPYRVFFDIPRTAHELLFRRDLALVEAAHPHIKLALQAKGEAALDELHRYFQRNIRSWRNQSVKMVGHDDKRVQEEFALAVIVEDGLLKQLRRSCDLKKAAAFGRHSGNQIRPGFLGREQHLRMINERPVAKATFIASLRSGA